MNFPFYIARRYLVSKKSHNIINIISGVSVAGVMIGTMALIIVLSVFNGFDHLVVSLFNAFNPDILIQAKEGKTFTTDQLSPDEIRKIPGVKYVSEIVEENALLKYHERQYIATIKGVGEEYPVMSGLDTMIVEGKFQLKDTDKDFAVLGYGVAYYLGTNLEDYANPISVYVPRRTGNFSSGLGNAFNSDVIFPSGYFSIQQDFDVKYVIVPIGFVKKILEYDKEMTSIEVAVAPGTKVQEVIGKVRAFAGDKFVVKDRFQQQEFFYKIMRSEKWAIFMILTFILLIATFNVVGSLSILIIDKKQDIAMLQGMGAGPAMIKKIFMLEGLLITFIGAVSGLIFGAFICWMQMRFGFIKLGNADSTFVIDSYPVLMLASDFLFVFLTVMAIGLIAAWYPVYNIRKIDTRVLYQRF